MTRIHIDRVGPDQYFEERSMPEPNSGCWIWLGATNNGYGVARYRSKSKNAHRLSYELLNGVSVIDGIDVCHKCDNRACVNPDHLFLGTRKENMQDCARKGRIKPPLPLMGDESPNSKLNASQVISIRSDKRSQRQIAKAYGVNRGTIAAILHRKTWRHI
jgi:hypothetical protein